jgi:4-amino-4-deoxy-L-arabinose transferase-like glycosyltransferase
MRIQWTERQQQLALAALCLLLYVPLAGSYGMWDPWETHYGEIARQMAARNDWISLWWPCSPQDRPEVFHKPVLHFWLMALSMKLFGLPGANPAEMVDSWRVEWACRLPNVFLSVLAIVAVWTLVKRLSSSRTAWWTAAILATSSQWVLVTRQAMTDLPFVAPMTAALAFAGLALHADDQPASRRAKALWLGMFTMVTFPQLLVFSLQLKARLGGLRVPGVVVMLPYFAAFAAAWWWRPHKRPMTARAAYLGNAWVLAAVASLAKGPAGLAMPALVLAAYLLVSGRAREILRLEIPRGMLLYATVAFPWYHAMTIRHGMPFWRELIGDNYVHRAEGRHGDRGGFDYYLQWLLYGTFPWTGVAAAGVLFAKKRPLAVFALVWVAVELTVLTLVNTKFHHYVLPILPAVAILAALILEEMPKVAWLVAAPLTFLAGRDLAAFPARLLWLFNYDYVNVPGAGRAWPAGFDYGVPILVFTVLATVFTGRKVMVLVAAAWTIFIADKLLIELSPHWSQKQVIAAYYRLRRDEPLVVWQLYWRGENFYTRNEIYAENKTVVMDDGKRFLAEHRGKRMYFLVERVKLAGLQRLVPGLQVVDDSNNKLYLALGEVN